MSTKGTLKCGGDEGTGGRFHLYRECFDGANTFVYLELEGVAFEAATSFEFAGNALGRVVVRIPEAWAGKLGLIAAAPEAGPEAEGMR